MILAQDLRDAVLQAAIQGKLTQQLASDSSVDELLEKIRTQKELLIKEKKIKKEKPLKPIAEDEIPFDIPDNWRWTKVGDTCINIQYGTSKKSDLSGKVPVLRMGNIQNGKIDYTDLVYSSDEDDIEKYSLNKGDLLFNRTNSFELVGKVALYNGEYPAIYAGYLIRFTPIYILSEYLNLLMQSVYYKNYCWKVKSIGIQQSNINANKLCDFLYPLPPLEEQQRIVERVSELMAKIDEFEKIEKQLSAIKKAFPQDMKDALLQAAMQGKLTQQLPSDSSVDKTIDRLKEITGKLSPCKSSLNLESMDFDIPDTWRFVELNSIFDFVDYRGKTPNKISSGIFLTTASNIRRGYMDYTRKEYISQEEYETRKNRGITEKGDLLFTTEAPLGMAAICDLDVTSCGQRVITLKPYVQKTVIPKLYMYFILSPNFQQQLQDNCTGTTAKGIKADKLKHLLIPLPPIEEQQRIVQTLEKMLVACEGL